MKQVKCTLLCHQQQQANLNEKIIQPITAYYCKEQGKTRTKIPHNNKQNNKSVQWRNQLCTEKK